MTDHERGGAGRLIDLSGRVYGAHLHGTLPDDFATYLRSPGAPPTDHGHSIEAAYRWIRRPPPVAEFWSSVPGPQATDRFGLFRLPTGVGLTVDGAGSGLFRIAPAAIEIEWLPGGAGAAHYFFSYALPLGLELAGVPVLHASCVSFGGRAVAFVGPSGVGKSTLCAGLVRAGCAFVADDGLPLREGESGEWRCSPGPPWLRLWPSALEHLEISADELPRVGGSLDKRKLPLGEAALAADAAAGLPLAAVYVLAGRSVRDGEATIATCTAREALVRLIEHSLAGAPVAALELSAARLEKLSRLATRTPVRLLLCPPGGKRWAPVQQAIAEDLPADGGT